MYAEHENWSARQEDAKGTGDHKELTEATARVDYLEGIIERLPEYESRVGALLEEAQVLLSDIHFNAKQIKSLTRVLAR